MQSQQTFVIGLPDEALRANLDAACLRLKYEIKTLAATVASSTAIILVITNLVTESPKKHKSQAKTPP